jgi:hypothetical protein
MAALQASGGFGKPVQTAMPLPGIIRSVTCFYVVQSTVSAAPETAWISPFYAAHWAAFFLR